uniref:Uncharacterized protein n=1 Tax=Solanum tuberosum TaxID=4113 RepID=M1DVG1_SOLTU
MVATTDRGATRGSEAVCLQVCPKRGPSPRALGMLVKDTRVVGGSSGIDSHPCGKDHRRARLEDCVLSPEGKGQVGDEMEQSVCCRSVPQSSTISPNDSKREECLWFARERGRKTKTTKLIAGGIGSTWVQLERVNPSPSPTHSARENEWAKVEDVLNAATRCSRKTELIRGRMSVIDEIEQMEYLSAEVMMFRDKIVTFRQSGGNKMFADKIVLGSLLQQPYVIAAKLLDNLNKPNQEIERRDFSLAVLLTQLDELTRKIVDLEVQCNKKGCYIPPHERRKLKNNEDGQINKMLRLLLQKANEQPRVLAELSENILMLN